MNTEISIEVNPPVLDLQFDVPVIRDRPEAYDGPTEITPGQASIVLGTSDKYLLSDITIGPIPQNYGLITWNGSYLTIS